MKSFVLQNIKKFQVYSSPWTSNEHIIFLRFNVLYIEKWALTEYFSLLRGCRQVDPISPCCRIICAEVLSHMIKTDKNIKYIFINNNEFTIRQYADDTQIFLKGTDMSLRKNIR